MWVGECICEYYWLVLFLWKLRVIVFRDLNLLSSFACKHQVSCYYVQLYKEFVVSLIAYFPFVLISQLAGGRILMLNSYRD